TGVVASCARSGAGCFGAARGSHSRTGAWRDACADRLAPARWLVAVVLLARARQIAGAADAVAAETPAAPRRCGGWAVAASGKHVAGSEGTLDIRQRLGWRLRAGGAQAPPDGDAAANQAGSGTGAGQRPAVAGYAAQFGVVTFNGIRGQR